MYIGNDIIGSCISSVYIYIYIYIYVCKYILTLIQYYVMHGVTTVWAKIELYFIASCWITMHVHCLHWLMSTSLLFQSAFYRPCKFMTKWCQWRALNCGVNLILLVLLTICLVVESWLTCGHYKNDSKFVSFDFFSSCCHLPPPTSIIFTGRKLIHGFTKLLLASKS